MEQIVGSGIDLVECRRIQQLASRYGERFLARIFTASEQRYCLARRRKWQHLSGRFAAKEAILKLLGVGWAGKVAWTDMEITNDLQGRPEAKLTGYTEQLARDKGIDKILVSISHTADHAIASAIGISQVRR